MLSPLSQCWYLTALATVSGHRAVVFMNLLPIIVLLFSAVVLGEKTTPVQILGTTMVLSGVILTTRF
ncbi:MAG: EamA family transporter [Candidatus Binatia bacterium]